nr:uncharacterized protein LOC111416976 [Onthophagus taurus]
MTAPNTIESADKNEEVIKTEYEKRVLHLHENLKMLHGALTSKIEYEKKMRKSKKSYKRNENVHSIYLPDFSNEILDVITKYKETFIKAPKRIDPYTKDLLSCLELINTLKNKNKRVNMFSPKINEQDFHRLCNFQQEILVMSQKCFEVETLRLSVNEVLTEQLFY